MKKYRITNKLLLVICLACCILLSGCSKSDDNEKVNDGKPIVYASFYPIFELVEAVAGDTIDLRSFMPLDQDPHLWEPTPKDMEELSNADLLVVNGANMERWVDQIRDNYPDLDILTLSDKAHLITYKGAASLGDFQYMTQVELEKDDLYHIEFGHTHENLMRFSLFLPENNDKNDWIKEGKTIMKEKGQVVKQHDHIDIQLSQVYAVEMGHESGKVTFKVPKSGKYLFVSDRLSEKILSYHLFDNLGELLTSESIVEGSTSGEDKITYDPHSWMSVSNAKVYLNTIQGKLSEMLPEYEKHYKKNKFKLSEKLTDLEYEYKGKFKNIENNRFVSSHNAYEYLAQDFELNQFPLQDLVSTEAPSLKATKSAVNYCSSYQIDTIFYEYGKSSKIAQSLAEEIDGQILPLVSMEFNVTIKELEDQNYLSILELNLENIYQSMSEEVSE